MTPNDFMIVFMMIVLGVILGKCIQEATAEAREHRKIKRDWEAMKRKELDRD